MTCTPLTPAQRALAEQHLPFVYWVVGKFIAQKPSGAWRYRADLEQAGAEALLGAVQRFDPARGALTTWAERQVYGAVLREWLRVSSVVRRGPHMVPTEGLEAAHGMASGFDVEVALDAARLRGELVARVRGDTAPARAVAVYLAAVDGETNRGQAAALGLSHQRVAQLRARGERAFQEYAAQVRAEGQ